MTLDEKGLSGRSKLVEWLDGIALRADQWRVPELLVLLTAIVTYGFNAWRHSLPMGYAGLFSLMADEIVANRFVLPDSIPFYGPGGIPFAYPPLGPYLAAFSTAILHIPLMTYLRFAPPVFGVLSVGAAYFMASRVLDDRYKGLLVAALFATSALEYGFQGTSSGMVRGLAMTFLLVGLAFARDSLNGKGRVRSTIILAGLAFGLTILTHLSYAVVFALSLALFAIQPAATDGRDRLLRTLAIAALAAVIVLPWLLIVTHRHGVEVFQAALATHGNLGVIRSVLWYRNLFIPMLWYALSGIGAEWTSIPLVGLFLAGILYAWMRGRWLLPLWFLVLLLATGEPDRFLLVVACLLIADLAVDVAQITRTSGEANKQAIVWRYLAPVAIVFAYCFLAGFREVRADAPLLSPEALSMGTWIQSSTPPTSTTFYVSGDTDLAEWVPYLTRRTPVVEPWGAEWIGKYDDQFYRLGKLRGCGGGFDCLMEMLGRLGLQPDYMIVPSDRSKISVGLSSDPRWRQVFENQGFRVFKRVG